MKIGVPKEIKPDEYRVGMTPTSVRELTAHGHEVIVESGAARGSARTTMPIFERRYGGPIGAGGI